MRLPKIRKDRQKNSSRGAQLCWCSIDTVYSSARAQSIRCEVVLVFIRHGAQFHSCAIESCSVGGALLTSCWILSCPLAQKRRVQSFRFSLVTVHDWIVPNRSCTIDLMHKWPVLNFPYGHYVQWVWCTIVSVCNWTVPNRSCTIDAVYSWLVHNCIYG